MTAIATAGKGLYFLGRGCLKLRKHLPTILTCAGVIGYGATVVETVKATKRQDELYEEYQNTGDKKKYIKGYVKNWAPTVGLFCVSTASVLTGHNVLRGRYLAVGTALQATEKAFSQYRSRVIADQGEKKDAEYRYGVAETIELVDAKDEEGQEVVRTQKQIYDAQADLYLQIFDERNPYWDHDLTQNVIFLRETLKSLRNHLIAYGHVTLGEAFRALGYDRMLTSEQKNAAMITGWVWDGKSEPHISFGPQFDRILEDPRDYICGRIPNIILEFNVDGVIFDKV